MKTHSTLVVSVLRLGCFFLVVFGAFAGTYNGKLSDLDAGNGYLTVTSDASQTTQTFKVTSQTAIVGADGKSGQLLDLIEGTLVAVEADPGDGKLTAKITVLPTLPRSRPEGP